MYVYIYDIYDVIGWWFEVAGIHVGCGIYAFDPTDHTHAHIVDLGSITEVCSCKHRLVSLHFGTFSQPSSWRQHLILG